MQSQNIFSKNQRIVMILVAAVIALSFTVSAQSVPSFTDYSPPDYLYLNWGDYLYNIGGVWTDSMAMNNSPVGTPRETAEYPYRTIFYGRTTSSESSTRMFVVYSKNPATDLFTFQYMGSDKSGSNGRIRAFIEKIKVNTYSPEHSEVLIKGPFGNGLDAATGAIVGSQSNTNFTVSVAGHGTQGTQVFFSFDFMYDCASEHQQGAHDLNINGLTSIGSVPYQYIIHCKDHTGYTGGGDNGGGSSTGGGNDGLSGDKNNSGSGGKHGWGDGNYGGGVDRDDVDKITDGGGYTSRPDLDSSVGDDWKTMPEDNYNKMPISEYVPDLSDFPAYVPAEGDTGDTGANWELPEFDVNGGVFGEIIGFKELVPNGKQGLIDFMAPMEEWGK